MHRVALPHVQPRYALTTYVYYCCIISTMHDRLYIRNTHRRRNTRNPPILHASTPAGPPGPPRLQDPPRYPMLA